MYYQAIKVNDLRFYSSVSLFKTLAEGAALASSFFLICSEMAHNLIQRKFGISTIELQHIIVDITPF